MTTATAVPRMKALYDETLREQLKTQLELGNVMQVSASQEDCGEHGRR